MVKSTMMQRKTRRDFFKNSFHVSVAAGATATFWNTHFHTVEAEDGDATDSAEAYTAQAMETRRNLASDPDRPLYHYLSPNNYLGDPNGTIYWKGNYHLFYQWNPYEPEDRRMHWGHAVSSDLLHWRDLPIALAPERGGPDSAGCFSGGALINKEGIPTIVYHGHPKGTCIATSDDELLVDWTKHPANPVIPSVGKGHPDFDKYKVFDPTAWIEGDTYRALIGNTVPGIEGDATSFFRSDDLLHWEHLGPFYRSERRWTRADEDCAVPNFFPLGDRHMLLFATHKRGAQYYLGKYSDHGFHPEIHGKMNYGKFDLECGNLVAPITFEDGQKRRIFFAWVTEGRRFDVSRKKGWYGIMSLPRVLSLSPHGTLQIEPVPELQELRGEPRQVAGRQLDGDGDVSVPECRGECVEIGVVLRPDQAAACGLKLRCSPNGKEQTQVVYHSGQQALTLDTSQSSLSDEVTDRQPQTGPLKLSEGEPLELRIFVDRTVVEVFANGRQCLTKRIYPTRPDSLDAALFARGGSARLVSLQAWEMKSVWPVA